MSGYEINEKDIAIVIRYLKIHNPENISREYAIQTLELMHEIAKDIAKESIQFAELFLQALKTKKQNERNAMRNLYDELIEIYGASCMVLNAFIVLSEFINEQIQGGATKKSAWSSGRDDPNNANAQYQYTISLGDILDKCNPDAGEFSLTIRNALIVRAYSVWEEKYRQKIAGDCGFNGRDAKKRKSQVMYFKIWGNIEML